MVIYTKQNIINYSSDPDEANDKKYPKELQLARKSLREEDQSPLNLVSKLINNFNNIQSFNFSNYLLI